jgi:hypothetical protein
MASIPFRQKYRVCYVFFDSIYINKLFENSPGGPVGISAVESPLTIQQLVKNMSC